MRATQLRELTLIGIGATIILVPILIIGYPLVYSDTGTYLRSAFTGYVPIDRPYWYGPFLRWTSLDGYSLWGVALAQALLCSAYIHRICDLLVVRGHRLRWFLIITAALSASTSLPWYAGQIIPDVFTAIALLAVFILFVVHTIGLAERALHLLVIAVSCWFHTSNLMILPIAATMLLILLRAAPHRAQRWTRLVIMLLASWGGLLLVNRINSGEAYISHAGPVFLMGRMADMGMLKSYLDEHCPSEPTPLCQFKDSLPANGQDFIWSDRGPVQRQGGWLAVEEEYSRIIGRSFTEPRYRWWHVRGGLTSTAAQLSAWEIGEAIRSDWYRTEGSPPYLSIADHMPASLPAFKASMQNGGRGELDMRLPDIVYRITLGLSVLILLVSFAARSIVDPIVRLFAGFCVLSVIIGAWVCASFSTAIPRYLSRDSWLIPLAALLTISWVVHQRRTRAAKS
jgi:hypothetical protein